MIEKKEGKEQYKPYGITIVLAHEKDTLRFFSLYTIRQ